jgi:hypothetical protein
MFRAGLTYLLLISFAFWMGGFSFYFGVVVRIGDAVIGGTEQGFITRQISWWLNIAGLVTIALMILHLFFQRSWVLVLSCAAIAVTHAILMFRHSQLEALLDPETMSVLDSQRFAVLHENYEFLSGCQWLAAMIYLGGLVYGWTISQGSALRRAGPSTSC